MKKLLVTGAEGFIGSQKCLLPKDINKNAYITHLITVFL